MTSRLLPAEGRPIPSLQDLGARAVDQFYLTTCLPGFLDRAEFTDLHMVRWLYTSRSCDVFAVALRELVNWPIVSVGLPDDQSVHRLNRDPAGRLVDVTGFVTLEELRQRYEMPELVVQAWDERSSYFAMTSSAVAAAMAAVLYLPCEPFRALEAEAREWARHGHVTMPANTAESPRGDDFFRLRQGA